MASPRWSTVLPWTFLIIECLAAHEQRLQRLVAGLRAPVPVQLRVEGRAFGQQVGGIEVLPRREVASAAVLQADHHHALQDEHPLRMRRTVELAAKTRRT